MGKGHIRAPDSGFSNRKFDVNRHQKERTGQYNFKTGKKERDAMKSGKGTSAASKGSLWFACTVVVVGALLLAAFVYYLAALELEAEEVEGEVDDKS